MFQHIPPHLTPDRASAMRSAIAELATKVHSYNSCCSYRRAFVSKLQKFYRFDAPHITVAERHAHTHQISHSITGYSKKRGDNPAYKRKGLYICMIIPVKGRHRDRHTKDEFSTSNETINISLSHRHFRRYWHSHINRSHQWRQCRKLL